MTTIAHAPTCPISDPELQYHPLAGRPTCNCDFGQQLRLYLQTEGIIMKRNFHDFLVPALAGLDAPAAARVALALDCAIAFGALESHDDNASLKAGGELERVYAEKIARLKAGQYPR